MNNIRYVIEWKDAIWDEDGRDTWRLFEVGEMHREIFEDETRFNYRITQLKEMEDDLCWTHTAKICGVYTCELQPIRGNSIMELKEIISRQIRKCQADDKYIATILVKNIEHFDVTCLEVQNVLKESNIAFYNYRITKK